MNLLFTGDGLFSDVALRELLGVLMLLGLSGAGAVTGRRGVVLR